MNARSEFSTLGDCMHFFLAPRKVNQAVLISDFMQEAWDVALSTDFFHVDGSSLGPQPMNLWAENNELSLIMAI